MFCFINPLYTNGLILIQSTWDSPLYISRVSGYFFFSKYIVFTLSQDRFTLTNSVDPGEMPQQCRPR